MSRSALIREHSEKVWRMWFDTLEDMDWDMDEVAEFFGGLVPEGVRVMHAWYNRATNPHRHDNALVEAAISSLAGHMSAWAAARMQLHLDGLQVVFKDFAQFGYERYEENLKDMVPDDLLVKDEDGRVDYEAIGKYYVTSRDMVQPVIDGRSAFFTRPGFEGEAGDQFRKWTSR